jgi:toxic protein SymE
MTVSNPRRLKIHSKSQARTHRRITIPAIRLEGKWLDQLGFRQGKTVIIEPTKNKLTIRVEQER